MKEVTTVLTIQLTSIGKLEDDMVERCLEHRSLNNKIFASVLEEEFEFDDVIVLDVKDFVRDLEENG